MTLPRPLALACAVLVVACDDATGPDARVQLAVIGGVAEPQVEVAVQDAGLVVDITTYGNSCTRRHHDDVDVDAASRVVTIRPYNLREEDLCFAELVEVPHDVRVDVAATGEWLVRVIGAGMPASVDPENPEETTITVERRAGVDTLIR